jgi:hypothetical protein
MGEDGHLTRSADGQYLLLMCYDQPPGTSYPYSKSTTRVVARVDGAGNVDTTTTTTSIMGYSVDSVAGTNGTTFWTCGNNGNIIVCVALQHYDKIQNRISHRFEFPSIWWHIGVVDLEPLFDYVSNL